MIEAPPELTLDPETDLYLLAERLRAAKVNHKAAIERQKRAFAESNDAAKAAEETRRALQVACAAVMVAAGGPDDGPEYW